MYDYDVFISYAHRDNREDDDRHGWVTKFHLDLKDRLDVVWGRKPTIWCDARLEGTDYFGDEIRARLKKVKVFVAVLSPGFINSKWCPKELDAFCAAAEQGQGVRLGNKSRIVKVVKTKIGRDQHPEPVQGLLGYECYETDSETGRPREFSQWRDGEHYQKYKYLVDDIAYAIKELLERIERGSNGEDTQRCVYLAQTTFDMQGRRDKIRRELEDRGYYVLPDKGLPYQSEAFKEAVRGYLQRALCSVHLVGRWYGDAPEGEEQPVVMLQNTLAVAQSKASGLKRLIWVPEGQEIINALQQDFVQALARDAEVQYGAEFSQKPLHRVIEHIVKLLESIEQQQRKEKARQEKARQTSENPAWIYLIHDQPDTGSVKPVVDYLYNQGYEVPSSQTDPGQADAIQYHTEMLEVADAILIYYGNTSASWCRLKLADLKKAKGYRQNKPLACKFVYKAAPESEEKEAFSTREVSIVSETGISDGIDTVLQPLLSCLEAVRDHQEE